MVNKVLQAIALLQYSIKIPETVKLISDNNNILDKYVLHPNHECSWIFVVEDPNNADLPQPSSADFNFTLTFLPKIDFPSPFSLQQPSFPEF